MGTPELRFGLAGTGYWARTTHAPALASAGGIKLTAVWGRNHAAAESLAAAHGATARAGFDALLADVDAVAFAVPPAVQAGLAVRAARAGKHLLLEKPIATSQDAAAELARAVAGARVASVVFFTARFAPAVRSWLASVAGQPAWTGGHAVWLGSALRGSSPFNTPWRQNKGGLWDVGPHAISLLWACLGPVVSVTADAGPADVTHLVLHHRDGASSTVTLTLSAAEAAEGFDLFVWGEPGRSALPALGSGPRESLRAALAELAGNARSGQVAHPCDAAFGYEIVRVLAAAQRQLDAAQRQPGALS
jgi:predicted dehydrogenase